MTIETPDRELGDVIAAALAPLASEVPPEYAIRVDPRDGNRWSVASREDKPKIVGDRRAAVIRVLGEVNAAAVESVPHQLVLHSAAVAAADGVVVLPAGPNHGKSTLTVALVRSGFAYLTDEAAAITRDGLCRPYPKPISLEPGSFAVHRDLAPSPRDGLAGELDSSAWHVSPDRIGSVGEAAPVIAIVLPRWRPESNTLLTPLLPEEALTALVGEAFDFGDGGQQVFDILCDLVADAQVWRLQYSAGHEAVSAIEHILATSKFLGK